MSQGGPSNTVLYGADGRPLGSSALISNVEQQGYGSSTQVWTSQGPNVLPLWAAGGAAGISWVDQTTTPVTMAENTGYVSDDGANLVTFNLATTCALGSLFWIVGKGSGLWTIAQASGQQIFYGNISTTLGAGGSLSSSAQYQSVLLVCITANTTFEVIASTGNLTYV